MASLVDSLMQQLEGRGAVDKVAGKLGVPPGQASSALTAAVPAILAGLARNTQKPEGVEALAGALERDHDGSVLEDAKYFDAYEERKGEKILGHVFGEQTPAVESQVSALAGLDPAQGVELMKMVAPLVMGYLGKEKSGGGLDISSLSKMLGGGSGGGGLQLPGGLAEMLGGAGGGGGQAGAAGKPGGLGGVLGKVFGRKKR